MKSVCGIHLSTVTSKDSNKYYVNVNEMVRREFLSIFIRRAEINKRVVFYSLVPLYRRPVLGCLLRQTTAVRRWSH